MSCSSTTSTRPARRSARRRRRCGRRARGASRSSPSHVPFANLEVDALDSTTQRRRQCGFRCKGKNFELSQAVRAYAEAKLGRLSKQLADETAGRGRAGRGDATRRSPAALAEATSSPKGTTLRAQRVDLRHAGLDRQARRRSSSGRSSALPREAAARAGAGAPSTTASDALGLFRRDEPLHVKLAREGADLARAGRFRLPRRRRTGTSAGIHGLQRRASGTR